jgi:hypothetical protein
MAWSLVGTIGAVATAASGSAATVAWGTGESRTAGNLLILWYGGQKTSGTGALPATPTGWTLLQSTTTTDVCSGVYAKIATGADAVPTVAAVASQIPHAQLAEFSGGDGTLTSRTGTGGSGTGTTGTTVTATNSAIDPRTGQLVFYAYQQYHSTSTADTVSAAVNNGIAVETNNSGTTAVNHYDFGYAITTADSVADKVTVTVSAATRQSASITGSFPIAPETAPGLDMTTFGTFPVLSGATINYVAVAVTHSESSLADPAPTVQLWNGSSAQIGSTQTCTVGTSLHTDTFNISGVTYSELASLQVRFYPQGYSGDTANVDAIGLTVNYTLVPDAAPVTVGAYNPTVTTGGNANAAPGVAAVTVAALAPSVSIVLPPQPPVARIPAEFLLAQFGIIYPTPNTSLVSSTNAAPGVANVTVVALNASVTTTGNANAAPGVANVAVAALAPTAQVSAQPGAANVAVGGLAPTFTATFATGVAGVTVAGLAPTPQVAALPSVANVTVGALQPSVTTGGNANANPGVANVAVAALAPTPQATVLPPVTNVTVAALAPTIAVSPAAGLANVVVAALAPALLVVAFPSVASVTVAALSPTTTVTPATGVANVTVAALAPTPQVGALPAAAAVTVAALAPSVTLTGNLTVVAGVATVTVVALQPTATVPTVVGVIAVDLALLPQAWATQMDTSRWDTDGVGPAWIMDTDPSRWSMTTSGAN